MSLTKWPWPREAPHGGIALPDRSSISDPSGVGLNWAHLDRLEDAVLSSLPLATYSTSHWEEDAKGVYLEMRAPNEGVHIALGFHRNAKYLDAGYFVLDEKLQRRGHATRLAQQITLAADDLSIGMIKVHAALDGGSYAWAAMAARPEDPDGTRLKLLARLNNLARARNLSQGEKDAVSAILRDRQDKYFMFNLSRLPADDGGRPGEYLLASKVIGPWDWYAFWDLTDDEHRNYIIKAIG